MQISLEQGFQKVALPSLYAGTPGTPKSEASAAPLPIPPVLATRLSSMFWRESFEENDANGYDEYGRSLGAQKRPKADAAGSLLTTPHDFALFLQAMMGSRGLSKQMYEQMLTPQIPILSKHEFPTLENESTGENKAIRLSYGLALGLYWTPYGEAFSKEGHDDSWRNYTVCFDKSGTGILIMTNSGNGEGIYKPLLGPYSRIPSRPSNGNDSLPTMNYRPAQR